MSIRQSDIDAGMTVRVEYGGGRTVRLLGGATGKEYVFSGMARVQDVDPRDVAGLLQSGPFRMRGVNRGGA